MNAIPRKTLAAAVVSVFVLAAGAAVAQRRDESKENGPPPGVGGAPPGAAPLRPDEGGVQAIGAPIVQAPPRAVDDRARHRAILDMLETKLTMNFPNETPLEDVLKYIKSNTEDPKNGLQAGLPIYFDPLPVEGEKRETLQSPVVIDLEGIPLRRTLALVLRQLGLTYCVADGLIVVSSPGIDDAALFEGRAIEPSPLRLLRHKAERGEMTAEERKEFLQTLRDLMEIVALIRDIDDIDSGRDLTPTPAEPSPSDRPRPGESSGHALPR